MGTAMCTGALFEVRTYRKSKPQQLLSTGVPEEEIETLQPACLPECESLPAHEVWDLAIN